MIMLCAPPACLKDIIFVTAYSYKLQTGSEPHMACVPASLPLLTRDFSSWEPSRAGRASLVTVHSSTIGQVPAARPFSVKPAQLCDSFLPLLSPLSPPLSLLSFPCSAPGSHPAQPPPASTCWHPGAPLAGPLWRSGVSRHCLHSLLFLSLLWLHLQGSWPSS